jgi:hypothetical protein
MEGVMLMRMEGFGGWNFVERLDERKIQGRNERRKARAFSSSCLVIVVTSRADASNENTCPEMI